MRKILVGILGLMFLFGTLGFASAAPLKQVYIRELCRNGPVIAYGIYDSSTNFRITTLDARGYLDLIDKLKEYEIKNEVRLQWNYYTNKRTGPESGVFDCDC